MALGDGIRRNIASVDPEERRLLVEAFVAINQKLYPGKRTDSPPGGVSWWFKQDEIHITTTVHNTPGFLPWHRKLVNYLEGLLREVNPQLSLHYWDWTHDPRALPNANLGGGNVGELDLFTPTLMGYGGATRGDINGPWYAAGFFVPTTEHNRDDTHNPADPPAHVYRDIGTAWPDPATAAQDQAVLDAPDYPTMWRALQLTHDQMHMYVNMGLIPASFRDPFVYLLHANVDRLYAMWQHRAGHPDRLVPATAYGTEQQTVPLTGLIEPWSTGRNEKFGGFIRPWSEPGKGDRTSYLDAAVITPPKYDTRVVALGPVRVSHPDLGKLRTGETLRVLADLAGDGGADLVSFADQGVLVARQTAPGVFAAPALAVGNFGYVAGGWRAAENPRFMADVSGDGRPDIVGFGADKVWVAQNVDGQNFAPPQPVADDFTSHAGWRSDRHLRMLAAVRRPGINDLVGFGSAGVVVAYNIGKGAFVASQLVRKGFGYDDGWFVDRHPRFLADVTGDGVADIVGFGDNGVEVALVDSNGNFGPSNLVVKNFGYVAGNWRVDRHPRMLADLTGDGRADIVGFGAKGVWVSLNHGDGTFGEPYLAVDNFGLDAGWQVGVTPRLLVDLTGDGRPDIVGFGKSTVVVALNAGDGVFDRPQVVATRDFTYDGGWTLPDNPRFTCTVDGRVEVVGFGADGVSVASFSV